MPKPLDIDLLRKLLAYDPETGALHWKPRDAEYFAGCNPSAERRAEMWNARFAGKETFKSVDREGYKVAAILGEVYRAHRVIWAMSFGEWPKMIDHINGIKDDNRLCNLRSVTSQENAQNSALKSTNTSGVVGVHWDRPRKKWTARIVVNGKHKRLGRFYNITDAIEARKRAELQHGFHPNHGRVGK